MPVPAQMEFFIGPSRCIGCQACVQACAECDTHKGDAMIQLDYIDRGSSPQTVPVVCMHCDSPTCAEVCPADAIKRSGDGVVQTARKPRCIARNNCGLACPFGVPKMHTQMNLMMKCDMCSDESVKETFERGVANLFPSYFALVMATGIISIATYRLDMPLIAWALLVINGAWLIAAVATQSISGLGTLLASRHTVGRDILLFSTLCMYLLGCMLYLSIIALIFSIA
jgi:Fe-S-cluster-containing hydrogenase component 2